ncbi:MAG TPA: hypothetical protein VMM76_27800 [Pirellulaceae bacterium]|nr:hypothetical protein [Pirellulaceae bacterium]
MWSIIAVASTLFVWVNDGFVFSAVLWLLVIVGYSQFVLPTVFRFVHRLLEQDDLLYFGVLCGWGLVAGPYVGVTFGILLPFINELGLSSFAGGVIGLVVGPLFAATEGLLLVGLIDLITWVVTGKGLAKWLSGKGAGAQNPS